MAKPHYHNLIKSISGMICGMMHRRKQYADSGEYGANEIFRREKRDYKKTPLRAGEAHTVNRFKEADKQMRRILQDKESEAYRYWHTLFQQQLKKPEKGMKTDKMGHPQPYIRLDTYIRAKLMKETAANQGR